MKHHLILCVILPTILFSCTKDEESMLCEPSEPPITETWNFPMTPGSYWIYDWYSVDSIGVSTPLAIQDSIIIIGDTVVDGETYALYDYQIMSGSRTVLLRRDDNGNIINHLGGLDYSYVEFGEGWGHHEVNTFPDNPMIVYHEMYDAREETISVPAGDFDCVDKYTHHIWSDMSLFNDCGDTDALYHTYHSPEVGEVKTIYYFISQFQQSCTTRERRLVDYFIAE